MARRLVFFCMFVLLLFQIPISSLFGQGIARSKGLGLRLSFWNITGKPTRIDVIDATGQAKVDVSGAGIGFFFFSRAYHNWFFELNLSAIGGVESHMIGVASSEINVKTIVPLSFGLRYDLYASRLPGGLLPFLSMGGGPYWATSVITKNRLGSIEERMESDLDYGYYLGGGVNWVITSWFALNFDLKHHFIKFNTGKDYSGVQFGLGFHLMWGRKQEVFVLKKVKLLVDEIYPAYHQFYSHYPIALVTVKNLIGYPIEVNVRCTVKNFSERPKDSGFVRVEKGAEKDIPVTALFGRRLLEITTRKTAIMDLEIEARASATYKKEYSTEVTIHSRNAWNGDMDKLALFLTPENPQILALSRKIIAGISTNKGIQAGQFYAARSIFNKLGEYGIRYQPDPNIPFYRDDRVQFAEETLKIRSGDCDDLVILYASMLESVGIRTAFVEVRDPQKELAHLYLMFDSGLPASQGFLVSSNEKRYVIRNSSARNHIWIPVETTLIEEGFDQAWQAGALEYLQDGLVRNGLIDGWVKIIDEK